MKQVLFWKYADLTGQALMLLPLLFIVSAEHRMHALNTYYTLGIWQTCSCMIHACSGLRAGETRRGYNALTRRIMAIIAATWLINKLAASGKLLPIFTTLTSTALSVEGIVMLVLWPVMSVWYATICMDEVTRLKASLRHRSEIHWKL